MEDLKRINIKRPLAYFKCGQFVGNHDWNHKRMCLGKDFEIIIGLKKTVYIQVGSMQYEVSHGNVLFIQPGIEYFGYRPSEEGASFFWLHFFPRQGFELYPQEAFVDLFVSRKAGSDKNEINDSIFLPEYFQLSRSEKPYVLMKQILDTANSLYYSTYAVDYLITELLIELTDKYGEQLLYHHLLHNEYNQKFAQILEWIRVNLNNDLTVQKIADTFSFNTDYLTRLFKKKLGMSTIRYINNLKLNQAKELLCTTNKSIKEIAYELHFNDEKYLMKLFKSYVGITPSQFRNAYTNTYINTVNVDPDIPLPEHLSDSY